MIGFTRRIALALLRVRWPAWEQACPAGPPVPDPASCADCDSLLLADLPVGRAAIVSCLVDPAEPAAVKLSALGLLPGVGVSMVQRSPVHVVRIGYTELALDGVLAARVRVRTESLAGDLTL